MTSISSIRSAARRWAVVAALLVLAVAISVTTAVAETCSSGSDLDANTSSALDRTGQQFFGYLAQGNSAVLQQNSIASLSSNFSGIDKAVQDHKADLSGATAKILGTYLLDASDQQGTIQRAEFLCGVWGANGLTPNSTAFMLPNLPAGRYALVTEESSGGQKPMHVSFILQQEPAGSGPWKLAGLQIRPMQIGDHDGQWFLQQARAYKAKGQNHNAYLYYGEARELIAPVPFMTTLELQRIDDEQQSVAPKDLPANGTPVDLLANGQTFKVTSIAPVTVGNGLDLVVRYESPGVTDQQQMFSNNMAVIKSIVQKYPEYRDAFAGVVARAEPTDYGTLLPMNEIK